jgi:hypothetical protein
MHLASGRNSAAHITGTYLPPETTLNNLPHSLCDPVPLADPNILPVHLSQPQTRFDPTRPYVGRRSTQDGTPYPTS